MKENWWDSYVELMPVTVPGRGGGGNITSLVINDETVLKILKLQTMIKQ
jgi:hypothetical protein